MAVLSKNGHEVARLTRQRPTDDDGFSLWRRVEYSVRANRWILQKLTVRFPGTEYKGEYSHNYGWKRHARLKVTGNLERWLQSKVDRGFTVTRSGRSIDTAETPLLERSVS